MGGAAGQRPGPAREGGGAPGTTLGTVFSNLSSVPGPFGIPKMNNMNGVAFRAAISGPGVTAANDTGIWAHNDIGALVLVAREGDAAVGMPAGTVYTGFHSESPVLNNLNQVAFHASIGLDEGIWATDPYGATHLVVRKWQVIEIDPGVMRTVSGVWPITGRGVQDGTSTSFNDQGQLAIHADFGADSGIIIADVNDQCRPAVADQPDPVSVAAGSPAMFSVVTTGPGIHTYQWRRDGTVLVDGPATGGGTIFGATTPTLGISGVWEPDAGAYDVQVTNLCGTRTSASASLTVGGGGCYPDCNGNGMLSIADFGCFQGKYVLGDMYADCNGDLHLSLADFGCFQGKYVIGCP